MTGDGRRSPPARRRPGLLACLLLAVAACRSPTTASPTVADRIAFHQAQVAEDPRLHPVWAELARAYLDRARTTRDPDDVRAAEDALDRSLELQPTFDAFRTRAALSNFRHRFEEAAVWGARAREAWPEDTSTLALQVEAALGAGDPEAAEALVAGWTGPEDFHVTSSRGRLHVAADEIEDAVDAYTRAAAIAAEAGYPDLERWALVRAAAAWIDSGSAARAGPLLDRAESLGDPDVDVVVHRAEFLQASGEETRALELLEATARDTDDPVVAVDAAVLARRLGAQERARRLADRAEPALLRAEEAGEVYTLGPLARLIADRDPERALELARRNASHDRSAEAARLVQDLEASLRSAPPR